MRNGGLLFVITAIAVYLIISFAWPVCIWLGGAFLIWYILQMSSMVISKENSQLTNQRSEIGFLTLTVKGMRDAAAGITIGIGFVAIIQVLLRTVLSFTRSEVVLLWEDRLLSYRVFVNGLLGYSILLKTLVVLVLLTMLFPQTKLVARYSKLRNWAEWILIVLLTATSFTFFSVKGVPEYRAEWSTERKSREAMTVGAIRDAQRRLIAAAYIENEINKLQPTKAKGDLKIIMEKLLNIPHSNSQGERRPTRADTSTIRDVLNDGTASEEQLLLFAKKLGKSFSPLSHTYDDLMLRHIIIETSSQREFVVSQQEFAAAEMSIRRVEQRIDSNNAPAPTIADFEICKMEKIRIEARLAEGESAIIELVKNSLEKILTGDKEYLLKPFAKVLIESVTETAVKNVYPKVVMNYNSAKLWLKGYTGMSQMQASIPSDSGSLERINIIAELRKTLDGSSVKISTTKSSNPKITRLSRADIGGQHQKEGIYGYNQNYIGAGLGHTRCTRTCTIVNGIKTCGPWVGPPGCGR